MGISPSLARKMAMAANAVLGLVLAAALLMLARDVVASRLSAGIAPPVGAEAWQSTSPRAERRAFADYGSILRDNVFGFDAGTLTRLGGAEAEYAHGEARTSGAAQAGDLRLYGTIAWPGKMGYAVIAGAGRPQEVYRQGAPIEGVGRLSKVLPDRVEIDQGGGTMTLMLTYLSAAAGPEAGAGWEGRTPFARRQDEGTFVIDKDAVQSSFDNPKNVMTDARLMPNFADGVQKGFVVREVKKNGLYAKLGLQNGDILLRVNEFEVSDAQAALQAFNALKGMDRVDLDIERDGQRQTLTYILQ